MDGPSGDDLGRTTAWVRGQVQGVGFRWWTRSVALELGVAGWARNLPDGRVEVVVEGPSDRRAELLRRLRAGAAAGAPGRVEGVVVRDGPARGLPTGFAER